MSRGNDREADQIGFSWRPHRRRPSFLMLAALVMSGIVGTAATWLLK